MMKTENEMNVNVPLEVVKASEIEPREVKWLWYPYIPFGKVTLLQGDPGDGKSKLMLSIAALLSKGEPLPFTDEETEPMVLLILRVLQEVFFSFKEAQERAEKEAREKERQERIKARKSKRGMER